MSHRRVTHLNICHCSFSTVLTLHLLYKGRSIGLHSNFHSDNHSSLVLYKNLQPEYQYANYLSEVKCFSNRRFRCGCHGLRVDTGRWEDNVHLDRKDRLCLLCTSAQQVEDEHHFLFDCPMYSYIRASHASVFQRACSVSDFFATCEANACGGFIRSCFSLANTVVV